MLIQAGTGDVLGKDAHRLAERATGCGSTCSSSSTR
jgi:hypothetical protein